MFFYFFCKQRKLIAYAVLAGERVLHGEVVGGRREGIRIFASGGRRGGGQGESKIRSILY